jgi:hypothetical protein
LLLIAAVGIGSGALVTHQQMWPAVAKPPPASAALPTPKPKKLKHALCKINPATGDQYAYRIPDFNPHDHMVMPLEVLGGDSVNPGHKWPVKIELPGQVYGCINPHHDGTHEEITFCGADSSAVGKPTKTGEITGWVNGAGGATSGTVLFEMPCEIPDDN